MPSRDTPVGIDAGRFWSTVMRSGEIGPGKAGGLRRLALTDADKEMRDLFVTWCTEAGCTVTVDRVGNIFARRPGAEDHLPPVLIGSHLDTQFAGGKYDGIVGVLAGLEILRTLDDRRLRTKRPLELVCWTNEEGARFTPPMVASGAFAGVFELDWVLGLRDDDGKTFGSELERIGYNGKTAVGGRSIDAYFELHIEQGPILDRESVPVGIVVGGYATRGMHVDIHGETAHAGPTPMDRRRNALVGASMLAVAVNEVGWKYHPTEGKATVARMIAWPNKAGILSEYAQLTCDVRHAERAVADQMLAEVRAAIPDCARRANVEMRIAGEWQFGNERFDPGCVRLIREAAQALGVPHRDILSQAGHDAYYISRIAPTAMIFTPCRDGISHNEAEHAELDYTAPGVNVLLHAVLARANR
ncbi:MAG TPA: Zn-dependent hydrolase [Verrucomicrobiae bacterium]|jgi:N-carbamoyl-L-amino-acid hydrolase|nr:Zn-dependent hydrolase [Verrucomicrobiae bacterium]